MEILVINSGSSSLKFSRYVGEECLLAGEVSGIGGAARLKVDGEEKEVRAGSAVEAVGVVFEVVGAAGVEAVGYRVVHPGARLTEHQRVTEAVLRELEGAVKFAPLHEPEAVAVIREGMRRYPWVGHFVCFDTVFHRTMPEAAVRYALPERYWEAGVRRYGFHGLSVESVVRQFGEAAPRRMVVAHLGSGCSVTALVEGKSVDTSMGLTPTGGVVMGTRPGDLDPGVVVYLAREMGVDGVEGMLNHEAGMVGLTGMANDMKAVRAAGETMALEVFTRSVRKTIGGYCWLLGGLDAVVFTGGIGEHDAASRTEILAGLEGVGVIVNSRLNEAKAEGMRAIHASESKTAVWVIPAEEELAIARYVAGMA